MHLNLQMNVLAHEFGALQIHGRFGPADAHARADSQVNYIYLLSSSCSRPTFWFSQIMVITGSAALTSIAAVLEQPPTIPTATATAVQLGSYSTAAAG
jgi:hypothetical protein